MGLNWWDEKYTVVSNIFTSSKFPVLPNTQYICKSKANFSNGFYEINKDDKIIRTTYSTPRQPFTTLSETRFLQFRVAKAYGTEYKNDICIKLANVLPNIDYAPYVKPVEFLPDKNGIINDMLSISPIMIILSNNFNVTLTATYETEEVNV